MAFTPQYHGPRMQQLPFIPEDPNAASMQYRQAGQFARGLSSAGNALILEATAQQNRINETVVTDAVNKAKLEIIQKEADILSLPGSEAQKIPGMLQELYASTYEKYGAGLSNGRMKEMFSLRAQNAIQGAMERGTRASLIQMNKFYNDSLELEFQTDLEEIKRSARPDGGGISSGWGTTIDAPVVTTQPEGSLSVSRASPGTVVPAGVPASVNTVAYDQVTDYQATLVNPDDGQIVPPIIPMAVVQRAIERSDNRIAEMDSGKDPRIVASRQRGGRSIIHSTYIKELALYDPRHAKAYMDQESVREDMPPDMMLEMHTRLRAASELLDASEDAEWAMKNMSPEDAMERAYTDPKYQGNEKARRQYLTIAEGIEKSEAARTGMEKIRNLSALIDKMNATGFDFSKLSREDQIAMAMDDTATQVWNRMSGWIADNKKAGVKMGVDEAWIWEMELMERRDPGSFGRWLIGESVSPGGNFEILLKKTAGDRKKLDDMKEMALKGVTGSAGGGSGENTVSVEFNPLIAFDGTYNKADFDRDEWDYRRNGMIGAWWSLVADAEENVFKRRSTYKEKEEIWEQLYRDVEKGNIDVRVPFFRQSDMGIRLRNERAGIGGGVSTRIDVDVDTLPIQERLQNHGENVVNLSPATGTPAQNFGVIEIDDKRQLPPQVIAAESAEVLRAYNPGEVDGHGYAPGDLLVYGKEGELSIFSPEGIQRGGWIETAVSEENDAIEKSAVENEKFEELNLLKNRRAELVELGNRISRSARLPGPLLAQNRRQIKEIDEEIERMQEAME